MIRYTALARYLDGVALAGALVEVRNHITAALAVLYDDDGVTPISNPVLADANGLYHFKAPAGLYDLRLVFGGYSAEEPLVQLMEDPFITYVANDEGSALAAGAVVYASGDGLVKTAESDGSLAHALTFAVALETTLADDATGRFRTRGIVPRAGTPGALGYLSATGTITETVPTSGYSVILGRQISSTLFMFKPLRPILLVTL